MFHRFGHERFSRGRFNRGRFNHPSDLMMTDLLQSDLMSPAIWSSERFDFCSDLLRDRFNPGTIYCLSDLLSDRFTAERFTAVNRPDSFLMKITPKGRLDVGRPLVIVKFHYCSLSSIKSSTWILGEGDDLIIAEFCGAPHCSLGHSICK